MAAGPPEKASERKPLLALTEKVLEPLPSRGKSQFQHFSEMSEVSITDFNRACAMAEASLAVLSSYLSILTDFLHRFDHEVVDVNSDEEDNNNLDPVREAIRKSQQLLSPDYWTFPSDSSPSASPSPSPSASPTRLHSSLGEHRDKCRSVWPADKPFESHPFVKFSSAPAPTQTYLTIKRTRISEMLDTIKLLSNLVQNRCPDQLDLEIYMPVVAVNGPFFILAPSLCNDSTTDPAFSSSLVTSLSTSNLTTSSPTSPFLTSSSLTSLSTASPSSFTSPLHPAPPPPSSTTTTTTASSSSQHAHHHVNPLFGKRLKKQLPLQQPSEDLYQALKDGRHGEVLEALHKSNLDLTFQDEAGWTLLHAACSAGNVDVANALLDAGAPLTLTSRDENLPVSYLVRYPAAIVLVEKMLKRYPPSVGHRNVSGETPLHAAVLKHNTEAVRMLLNSGADPNVQTKRGESPLHYAVRLKNQSICAQLINANADFLNLRTERGKETALDLAKYFRLDAIVEMMQNRCPQSETLLL